MSFGGGSGSSSIAGSTDVVLNSPANNNVLGYNSGLAKWQNQVPTSGGGDYDSVTNYGAVGNGVADDTVAINAAIAAVTDGGTVFFPPGYYKFSTLTIPSHAVHLLGAGCNTSSQDVFGASGWSSKTQDNFGGSVLISTATSGNAIKFTANTQLRGSSISKMMIVGPGSGTSKGLVLGAAGDSGGQLVRFRLDDVIIANFEVGLSTCCENSVFNALYIVGCLTGLYTESAFNGNTINGINVEACTNYAIRMTDSDSNTFNGGVIQSNSGTPLALESAAYGNTFISIYFEQASAAHNVDIGIVGNADYNALIGCHWSGTPPNIRIAGNHNSLHGSIYCPAVTLSGNWNNLQGTFNGGVTDTGANNYVLNLGAGTMKLNGRSI